MAVQKQSVKDIAHQAEQAFRREDFMRAMLLYRKALKRDKNDPELLRRYGHTLALMGYNKDAIFQLERAYKRRPNHLPTLMILSFAQLKAGRMDDVQRTLDRALAHDPMFGPALLAKIDICADTGQPELARGLLDEALAQENPDPLVLIAHARQCRSTKEFGIGIDAANRVLDREDVSLKHKGSARFTLAQLLDGAGEYDRAFEQFRIANGATPPGQAAHADSTIANWSKDVLDSLTDEGNDSELPVMVIGMPRSGTTLTEQIIAAHPNGGTVGEAPILLQQYQKLSRSSINDATLARNAEEYLEFLEPQLDEGVTRVIDKHMNSDKTLGMTAKMFPNARFIHCLRDPMDCCLSAYFQGFGHNLAYARDLTRIGEQYIAHRTLMDYWQDVLDREIMVSVYEDLVDNPEEHVGAMLAHIGLAFDESCLRFHESKKYVNTASATQVRKPIYASSKQRWKNYEKHLGPLITALGEYGPG